MTKPIPILSVLVVAALAISAAVAERVEMRAQHDRFSFGAEHTTFAAQ